MVGGFREKDYQLAAQKRNEACRRLDYHCRTARYFERESRLAEHFNSWTCSSDSYGGKFADNKAARAERLRRRQHNLRKMLGDEEADYRSEIKRATTPARGNEKIPEGESVEELRRKLDAKRAERTLYYPHNYGCFRSCNGVCDSVTSCPRHYENEHHIDACRNSQVSMEETNLRNYSTDCQGRKENPENRHHGEKRHIQGHTIYGTNIDAFGDFSNRPTKTTGERRHYEASIDSVDEGTNHHHGGRGDTDNVSVVSGGNQFRDEQERSVVFSGHAAISERRHYTNKADSFGSLPDTNWRQNAGKKSVPETELGVEEEQEPELELDILDEDPETENLQDQEAVDNEYIVEDNNVLLNMYANVDSTEAASLGSRGFNNVKNSSTDNINFSWKYDDPAKRPVCFQTHNQLIHQIQDLANRELQACKKQNWSEALRLRDMRNRLELQREVEVFNRNGLNMDLDGRRSEMVKLADRIELMNKREAGGNQHLIYSEEARILWEKRVQEDNGILSNDARAQRETLLKELEEEWEAMTLQDKERVAEKPAKINKSHLQEELELTAAAMVKAPVIEYHASNEESKNSCTRNKDKGASSLIFLG